MTSLAINKKHLARQRFNSGFGAFWPSARKALYFGSPQTRMWLAGTFALASFASALIYIIAVNGILLNGEAVKGQAGYLKTLERDYFKLRSALVSRESPAWLEGRSRDIGMVETNDVRFIGEEPSVALSK